MFLYSELRHDSRVEREARTLVDEGWELRVIAANDPLSPRDDDAYERRDGYEIVRVDRYPLPARIAQRVTRRGAQPAPATTPPTAPAARPAARDAVAAVRVPWRLAHRWLDHGKYVRRAVAEARRWPADLWICHDLSTLPAGAAAKRALGGALIYDSHELWLDRNRPVHEVAPERWRWQGMESRLVREADATMTVCDSIADILAERYGIPRPAVVRNLPEARTDGAGADLRALAGIESELPIVLFLGGLQRNRGLATLVRAMPALEACELVLMGAPQPGIVSDLGALAGRLGVHGRVHVVPPVPVPEVVGYARSAHVGVAPIENAGLSYWYSLPNKLFEYLHAGLPVVTSDFPEMARVVAEHGVGETFASGDSADLARAIRSVLAPERRERLVANARAAANQLTWERERARFLAAVESALKRG